MYLSISVNDDVSIGSIRGRILKHVLTEVTADIIPHFNFNSTTRRFVRRPPSEVLAHVPECERDAAPKGVAEHRWYGSNLKKQYEAQHKLVKGFFGMPHVEALLKVLAPRDTPFLIDQVLKTVERVLLTDVASYFTAIVNALPPGLKLPGLQVRFYCECC